MSLLLGNSTYELVLMEGELFVNLQFVQTFLFLDRGGNGVNIF